jgi:4-oxalomesaconate hydratase
MMITRRDFAGMASAALASQNVQSGTEVRKTSDQGQSKARVLAVSAHPADFCSRAGGTLIKHVRAGCKVKVVWLSHGETDESQLLFKQKPNISLHEVRQIREKEAFACAKVIGCEARMFGFGDNPIRMTPERMEMLAKEIADFNPTIILTHWRNEVTYPSHWVTSQSVIQATQMAHVFWNIHFFEPNIGTAAHVGFVPDHYVDITDVFEQKIAALKELPTQPALVENYTACNRWRGLEVRGQYAEAFVRWAPKVEVANLLD